MQTKINNFEQAFDMQSGSCVETCACGKRFFDNGNDDYDWDEGELEELKSDPEAIPLDYSVNRIKFEGTEYVPDCDCWKERARKIIGFLDSHAHQIAKYLTLEKKRKQKIADAAAVVE